MTTAEYRQRFPEVSFVDPRQDKARAQASAEAQRKGLREDPIRIAKAEAHGQRLSRLRANATLEQNTVWQKKSVAPRLATSTPEERSEAARRGGIAANKLHPELAQQSADRLVKYNKSAKGRARRSEISRDLWANSQMRAVAAKNSEHTKSGRIPVVFNKVKPTPREQDLLTLITKHRLPFQYVGDGALRITIPNGSRAWRNPDFVSTDGAALLLLDQCANRGRNKTQNTEDADYAKTSLHVLRLCWADLNAPAETVTKIRAFLADVSFLT